MSRRLLFKKTIGKHKLNQAALCRSTKKMAEAGFGREVHASQLTRWLNDDQDMHGDLIECLERSLPLDAQIYYLSEIMKEAMVAERLVGASIRR